MACAGFALPGAELDRLGGFPKMPFSLTVIKKRTKKRLKAFSRVPPGANALRLLQVLRVTNVVF